jgi:hypothetical protein
MVGNRLTTFSSEQLNFIRPYVALFLLSRNILHFWLMIHADLLSFVMGPFNSSCSFVTCSLSENIMDTKEHNWLAI